MNRVAVSLATMVWALCPPAAEANPICRWVDESGRTQIGDAVPDKYRKVATCTDSQKYELSPEERRAVEQRVAEEKARARKEAGKPLVGTASTPPGPASGPAAKRPVQVVTDSTDCPTWWRIYEESVECFGPYRTTRGATRPEAFDSCNLVPNPEPTCGPKRD